MDPITASTVGAKLWDLIGIKGLISIALAVALGIAMVRADTISTQRDSARQALATESANHAVTRNSVELLEQSLTMYVGAGQAARVAQLASIEAQAKDSAELQAQADAIRAEMAAGDPQEGCKCSTPGIILRTEGL